MGVRLPPPPAPKISPAEKRQKLSKLQKGDRQGSTTELDPQEALGTSSKRKSGVFGKASAPESRLIVVDDVSANKSAKLRVRQSLVPVGRDICKSSLYLLSIIWAARSSLCAFG